MERQRGFTLLEVLLSVSIITILVGMSLPLYQTFQVRNDLDITAEAIASSLRRAQVYARGVNGDAQWGVEVQSTAVTLFRGAVFASRDPTYDEPTSIPASMSVSGLTEVLFSKLTGAPSTTGNIVLTTTNTNDTRTININAEGMVSY